MEGEKIRDYVRRYYGERARRSSCCGATSVCCEGSPTDPRSLGYSDEDLEELPEAVVGVAAGCGNPIGLAGLREGEVVLDLGSGGGIDALLAARRVGPRGRVIGVDMTEEMVRLAGECAEKMGVGNVEFRLGEIEDLPVEDGVVDVVISNCVINLSPDKNRVFAEAYRVLRPGGRIVVSDVVTEGELPPEIREDPEMWAACVAGALTEADYLQRIRNAGFEEVKVIARSDFMEMVSSIVVRAYKARP